MELNYRSFGKGEPLVVLHGLWGMLDNWVSFAHSLESEFEIFLPDLRNHGKSPHSDEHNYRAMADDLKEFLAEQNIFSVNILGHSMGGKVAIQFATDYPGLVKKLIVADIFPRAYNPDELNDHIKILEVIKIISEGRYNRRTDAEIAILSKLGNERTAMFMFKNLNFGQDGLICWKFNAAGLVKNYPRLSEQIEIQTPINTPTLFIRGKLSNYITEKDTQQIPLLFRNAKLETLENAGHWLHVDQPSAFRELVAGFLKS